MSFSEQIAAFGPKASKRIDAVRQGVVIKLFGAVIMDTPVLTGRARGNWQISESAPIKTEVKREDKSGRAPMAEVEELTKKTTGDCNIYLVNRVPYALKLEEGFSKKAPEGMVKKNVIRFARLIKIEVAAKK